MQKQPLIMAEIQYMVMTLPPYLPSCPQLQYHGGSELVCAISSSMERLVSDAAVIRHLCQNAHVVCLGVVG